MRLKSKTHQNENQTKVKVYYRIIVLAYIFY